MTTEPILEADQVSVRFGGIAALQDISLHVNPDEVVGVIGPNGAGKTTFFDVISGIRLPGKGTVRLDGVDITRRSSTWRARHGLRRTFQRPQIFGALTVEDNLLVALEWRGIRGGMLADLVGARAPAGERRRRQRAAETLEMCGLDDVRLTVAGALPTGLARVAEFARAVVDRPKVLLLDEPTSGLGESETALVSAAIRRVRSDTGCSMVVVEHDVRFVVEHCDRIVVLDRGAKIADGTPDEVRANPAVRAAYLG